MQCRIGFAILSVLLCTWLHRPAASAQPPAPPPDRPATQPGSAGAGDVYINDSFEAADALSKARSLTEQERWREAAELLQQASDTLADHVVQTPKGYMSLRTHIAEVICRWPQEGLQAYQGLFDSKLQRDLIALGDAPDVDAAVGLFDQYFCTSGAAAMADRIAQFAIESGDLPLARWALDRVLTQHPSRTTHAARLQTLIMLVSAMMGAPADDDAKLSDARLRWKGRDATLKEALGDVAREFRSIPETANPHDWPMFGGNPQRNRDSHTDVDQPGLLWRFTHRPQPPGARPEELIEGLAPDSAESPAVFTVVAGDLVFIQTHRNITTVHRNSGAMAWALRSDKPDTDAAGYSDEKPLGGESPVVDEGRLFAALPTTDSTFYDYETARTVFELVSLDARSGSLLWRISQKGTDAQGTATAYDSAPVARNGRVYIVSRKMRTFGFEDSYLDAYRAADGKLLFRTHLASASTSAFGLRGATRSIAALQGDFVYICTNLGTIAAVNAYTGGVRWLKLYDRLRPDGAGSSAWPTRIAGNVPTNPVIWSEGRVAVLPTDSDHLLVLSESDGQTFHDVRLDQLSRMHTLYGIRGDLICGAGEEVLCYDLNKQTTLWAARLKDETALVGRGMWLGDELLIPRRDGLSRIRVLDGKSRSLAMGPHYEGGNMLALPEQILVAGSREILCYVRKAEIWKNIQERMAAAPNDPLPALEFAEVALGAGEIEDAMRAMKEAASRAKPTLIAAPTAVRSRFFADALRLLAALPPQPDPADVETLFRYASESAENLASQVEYRFRFAEFFENSGQPQRAIRLYQQILRDRSLRNWPPTRADATIPRSHVRAKTKIAELIKRFGIGAYAEFEKEAHQWLEAARTTGDEVRLDQLIEEFPNSVAASTAMVVHAETLEQAGRHEASAKSWERAYNQQHDSAQRPKILRRIAENYVRADRPELAYLWLAKAAREYPAASFEFEGRITTFAAYRDRLSTARSRIEPARPNVKLPLKAAYELDLVGPVHLLAPRFGESPEQNWSHIYLANPDGIRGYHAGTGKDLWIQPAPVRMSAELLTARPDFALFGTPFEVFALEVSTGQRRYSHGEYPPRLVDPGADWEDGSNFRAHALHGDHLVSVREDGTAICLNIRTGDLVWKATRRPAPLGPMRLNDSVLVYHISREGRAVIQIVSAATGELVESIVTDEQRPVEELHITLDGFFIMVTSKSLSCYDATKQERRWHVALNWPVRRATLQFDLDSVYFMDEAGVLKKISLDDGNAVWESERLLQRGDENETVHREGEYLFVSTSTSVSAVDVANGLLLWQGTTPENPRFAHRLLTRSYFAMLNSPGEAVEGTGQVYFYDHRNASGVIPRVGGVLDLGMLSDVRGMLAADGALLVQTGSTVRGFTQTK